MRKIVWGAAAAVLFAGHAGVQRALAQGSAAPSTVYVVDMQRVINESLVGKAARTNLESEIKKRELTVAKARQELEKLKADLDKQSGLLSAAALEEKRQVLSRKERDFGRLVTDQRTEIGKRNDAEMVKALKEIDGAIAEIGGRGDRPFIIEKDPRLVVYAHDRLDITADVIKALNDKKIGL